MKFNFIYTTFSLLFLAFLFTSNRDGRPGTYAGAPLDSGTCSTCHTGSGSGNIQLTGLPATIMAGQTYNMTLTITDASAIVGGFQIVSTDDTGLNNNLLGTFNPGTGQNLNNVNRLVQSAAANFSGGSVSWPISWTAPTPAETVVFYYAGNAANNDFGNGSGDVGYVGNSTITLPVQLAFFEARPIGKRSVKLYWQTHSEINSDYYEIQRSVNGSTDDFESIGRISAHGFSIDIKDYEFEDESPDLNQLNYYRLKQVDFDGKFTYTISQGISLERDVDVQVFPSPVRGGESITVVYGSGNPSSKRVALYNSMGQKVLESSLGSDRLENGTIIDLPNLSSGTYYLSVIEAGRLIEVKKISILD